MAGPCKDKLIKFSTSPLDLLPQRPLIERGVGALVMQLSFVHFLLASGRFLELTVRTDEFLLRIFPSLTSQRKLFGQLKLETWTRCSERTKKKR